MQYQVHSSELEMDHQVHLLPQNNQLRALHTIIRDRNAARGDFVFYSRRVMRLLIEESLNLLPFEECEVQTPVGETYPGLKFSSKLCGVPIIRAGESMELELRAVCDGIRVGKILIQRDKDTKQPTLYYSNLPADISHRHILLLDPMLATGGTACAAIKLLEEKGVREDKIIFVNFIASPQGLQRVRSEHPNVQIVTSSIERTMNEDAFMLPGIGDFGDRFFGTVG